MTEETEETDLQASQTILTISKTSEIPTHVFLLLCMSFQVEISLLASFCFLRFLGFESQ